MSKSSALSLHRRSGSRSCSLRDLRKRQTVIRQSADASHVRGYFSGFPFGVAGGAGLDLRDPRNMRAKPAVAGLAIEQFMPIILSLEARQVAQRTQQHGRTVGWENVGQKRVDHVVPESKKK